MPELTDAILEKLFKKREQLDALIQKRQTLQKEKERKADTRRKIILGGVCLKIMKENPQSKTNMLERVKASIKPEEYERLFSVLENEAEDASIKDSKEKTGKDI